MTHVILLIVGFVAGAGFALLVTYLVMKAASSEAIGRGLNW